MSVVTNLINKLYNKGRINNQNIPQRPIVETKFFPGPYVSYIDNLFRNGLSSKAFYACIAYYQQCAPLYTAIQLISDEIATIIPYIFDTKNLKYEKHDPLLNLLDAPNADITGSEFLKSIASYFLITGNCFIVASGNVNRPPLELQVLPPYFISLIPGKDGYIEKIIYSPDTLQSFVFDRKVVDGRFRYYCGDDREIWHIREFNPLHSANSLFGMSKLMPIFYEIEQYINASIHNLSMLKNGARPSGALISEMPLADDQYMRLQEQIDRLFSSPQNAGRPFLFQSGLDFKEMSMTNKDMDFMELKTSVTNAIYTALKIPLPMISPAHMTLANMDSARLNLYDNTVIPLINRIFHELSNFLMPRFKIDKDVYELTFAPDEISALEPRRHDELKKIKDIGVLTINEIRSIMGYEALQGGDNLFGQATEVPIAEDTYTADEPKEPYPKSIDKEFYEIMSGQRNPDNSRKYSDEFIIELAKKYDF